MTIGEFAYRADFGTYGRIVVYAHTLTDKINEIHKVYDSNHPRFQGYVIPEEIQKNILWSVGPIRNTRGGEGLCLHYKTDKVINDYL